MKLTPQSLHFFIPLLLAALPLQTHAICADGECSGAEGVIYANNCHYIATGSLQGYCHGGWLSGYNIVHYRV
ncbi:uncharacterized protein BDW47DRAFT_121685 [Aspergillus candidus]|uniref:Uncharacterized protein n=1 Tax=Aspergillus candidus TaxID=41067 RepID=A0A2I2FPM5_ASPCN|nr:hypothetical protein BDW47DRAFT_121685 [Aspergillus candidus]PLB42584.1 hypothetical protein BDW47DRAFT_121685 [Aspergillus candidus]